MAAPDPAHPVLVHFYRAVVSHADVWRQRMDATTNWAAATTAGMVTFVFGAADAPHFVLLLALAFDVIFLLMESRRYQTYDLWRRRFRVLNRYLVAPVLRPAAAPESLAVEESLAGLAGDLGRTVPHLGLTAAAGYRLRRNYGYLFAVVLLSWLGKLDLHPTPAGNLGEFVARAAIGGLPGAWVLGAVAVFALGCFVLAVKAPSERMLNWTPEPSPAEWMLAQGLRWVPGRSERKPGSPA